MLYINGEWVKSKTEKKFRSINPTNSKVLAEFYSADKEDVDKAIEFAREGFNKWRKVPPPKRGEILLKAAQIMRERKEELGKLVSMEMGKVLKEGLGDVQEAIDMLEYTAGEGRRLFGHTTTSELENKFSMTKRDPVGVFALITPWNFPIAIPSWKIAPALICGNSIIFKPSSETPLCAKRFVEILAEAGVPNGVLNLITGPGSEIGNYLVEHDGIDGISFTGSMETGSLIAEKAGKNLRKVGLELGGKNAIIVMDDADLSLALDAVIWGAFGTAGQRCTACSRLILHEKVSEKFKRMLISRTEKLRLGNPIDKKIDVGPLVNESARKKVVHYVNLGIEEGAKICCGGKIPKDKNLAKGFFFQPTVFENAAPDMRIAREEIFGPVVSIIEFRNLDEAIEINNSVEYGLVTSIITKDINNAFRAIEFLDTGLVYVNSSTIGSEVHLPFGGNKRTGNGTREAGIHGIEEFSEVKTIYIDYSKKLQKAQGID